MRKKVKIIALVALALLVITNPSLSRFKEFIPSKLEEDYYDISRTENYFFCSMFEVKSSVKVIGSNGYLGYRQDGVFRYIGVLGNFYYLEFRKTNGIYRR
jgi:hypothetical protein